VVTHVFGGISGGIGGLIGWKFNFKFPAFIKSAFIKWSINQHNLKIRHFKSNLSIFELSKNPL
jgi:hypothetical protein